MMFLRLWIVLIFFAPSAWAEDIQKDTPETQFRQAVTWYKVARATENSFEAHSRAFELYEQVIERTDDPALKQAAERGKIQAEFRLDNAHDTYRTLFDPVWWISAQDTTIEWYDDVYMLALGNAWNAVNAHLEKELDPENHVAVVYVTRNRELPNFLLDTGTEDFEFNREYRLKLMRDEIIGFAEATPSITGIPDDVMPLVQPWLDKPTLTGSDVETIASALNTQGIVLIHANIDDEIPATTKHLSVTRVSLSTQFWKVGDEQPYATIKSVGVGQDASDHHWMATLWLAGVLLLAYVLVIYNSTNQYKWHHSLLITTTSFFIGSIWCHLAFAFAMDYQVDWGQASLIYESDAWQIPYVPSMRWAWVLGLVLLNAPILILGWALGNIQTLIFALIPNKELQWKLLLPTMLAGALTWLFMPLVHAHTAGGIWVAIPLTLGIVFTAHRLAPLTSYLFQGHKNMKNIAIIVIAIMFVVSLSFPLGFFNGWHIWVSLLLVVLSTQLPEPVISQQMDENGDIDVNATNPFLNFPLSSQNQLQISEAVSAVKEGQSIQILDDGVMGQSDIFIELTKRLQSECADKNVLRLMCTQGNNEQFSFVQRLLQGGSTADSIADTSTGNLLTESVDNIVSSLPGVEFVMGFLGESASALSRESIVKDLVAAMEYRLKKSRQPTVWLIDNAQFMDVGSVEVLQQLVVRVPSLQIVWEQHSSQPSFFADLDVSYTSVLVELMSEDGLRSYLANNNVDALPDEVITEIVRITGGELEQIRGVLAYLFDQDLLQQCIDGRIESQINVSALSIQQIVPNSYSEIERGRIQRLESIHPSYRRILECASACGHTFYVSEVACALEKSVMEILESLEDIERHFEPSILFDVPEQQGVFQFGSRLTRDLLHTRLQYGNNGLPREFAVQIHRQILTSVQSEHFPIPLVRLQYHARRILHLHPELYVQATMAYLQDLQENIDWPEIINVVHQNKSVLFHFSEAQRSKIATQYAKALRNSSTVDIDKLQFESPHFERLSIADTAPVDGHHAAMQLMTLEIDRQLGLSTDLFELIDMWCRMCFVSPSGRMSSAQKQQLKRFKQYVEKIIPMLSGIERYYVESFALLARKLEGNIAPDLQTLIDKIRQEECSPTQEFVLGSVLKEYAAQLWFNTFPDTTSPLSDRQKFWSEDVSALYAEADHLMLKQNDWIGLATSYGLQGNILTDLEQWDDAIRKLDMDLELVDRYHILEQKAWLHKRLSDLYIRKIQVCIDNDTVNETLELIMQWFKISEQHEADGRDVAHRMQQPWIIASFEGTSVQREQQLLEIQKSGL